MAEKEGSTGTNHITPSIFMKLGLSRLGRRPNGQTARSDHGLAPLLAGASDDRAFPP